MKKLLTKLLVWTGIQGNDGILSLTFLFAMVVLIKFASAPSLDWVAILPLTLPLLAQAHKRNLNQKTKAKANAEDMEQLKVQFTEVQKTINSIKQNLDPQKVEKLQKDVQQLTESEALRRLKGGR